VRAARGSHNAGSRARGRDHHRRRAAAPQLCLGHQRRRWIRNDQAAHVADQPAGQSDQHQRSPCFLPRLLRAHGSAARRCISRRHDASAAWQQVGSGNASARERAAAARRVAGSPIPARDARLLPNDGHSDPADAASIRTTARPHTWGEERIAAELRVKLGMTLSPRTVRRYMPSRPRSRGGRSAWNLTDHPAAAWTTQQFRNGLPLDSAYRLLVHDRDGVFACGGRGPSVDVASGAEDAGTCRASECTL